MTFAPLPDGWPEQRETLRRIGTHVVAQAEQRSTGHFSLVTLPGGFGTPQFGPDRDRVRVAGGSLFVERADGERDGSSAATTRVASIDGSTIAELCAIAGFVPDPELSVGGDTPELGDPDEPLTLDSATSSILGDWWALGHRAIDHALATRPDPQASIARLWPEHFDVGIDLAVAPGVRCNLGASAGDGSHEEPYLYVGPWDDVPEADDYWNAPFGAVLGYADVADAHDPLHLVGDFFVDGITRLHRDAHPT